MAAVENKDALSLVWDFWTRGNLIMQNAYPELKNRNLTTCLRLWQTRYNGYSTQNPDLMFLNFTRNVCVSYIAKVAASGPKTHIASTNKVSNSPNKVLAEILSCVNKVSLIKEGADAKYRENVTSQTVKGTVIVYEGYKLSMIEDEEVLKFNALTGKYKTQKTKRVL